MADNFDLAINSVVGQTTDNTNILNPSLGSQQPKKDSFDLAIDQVLADETAQKQAEFLKGTEQIPAEQKAAIQDYSKREAIKGKINLLAQYDKTPDQLALKVKQARELGLNPSQLIDTTPETEKLVNEAITRSNIKFNADLDTPTVYSILDDGITAKVAQDSIYNLQLVEDKLRRQAEKEQKEKEERQQTANPFKSLWYGVGQAATLNTAIRYWVADQFDYDPLSKARRDRELVNLALQVEDLPHDLRVSKLGEEYDKNGLGSALWYGVTNPTIATSVTAQALPTIAAGGAFGRVGTGLVNRVVQNRIANAALRNYVVKATTLGTIGAASTAGMAYSPNVAQGYQKTGDYETALDRARTQTAVDTGFGALGGVVPLPTMFIRGLGGRLGNVINVFSEANAQAIAGGAGAYYSAKAVGEEISNGEIFVNFIMGYITTPADIAIASFTGGKQFNESFRSNLETARAVIDETKNMALTGRDGDTTKQVIARIKEQSNSPIQDIYLPAEEFSRYFQEQGIDPAALAEQVTGREGALDEALATGTDLQIPLENYAVDIAAKGHDTAFADILRTAPDAINFKELGELTAKQSQLTEQINKQIQESSKSLKDNRVYNDVYGQLMGIKVDRATAEKQALLYSSVFNTLAERLNIDPMSLYGRYKLQIQRELPEVLTNPRQADNLDILINRLRNNDIPTETEARGKTLFQRIRELGGIKDEGGELANRDIDYKKKGKAKIINKKGRTLDEIAAELARDGYLTDNQTGLADIAEMDRRYTGVDLVNILLNKIAAEARGEAQYSNLRMNDDLFSLRQQLGELKELVQQQNLDLTKLTNKEIKDRLTERYNQQYKHTDARGFIDIAKDGKVRIKLTDNVNLSTFLHESGHFFLNVLGDVETLPEAKADIKGMTTAIKKWLKADSLKDLTVDQHEKFARGFEAYLFEGKAPNIELQSAFTRFKVWLAQVYKTIANLNVKLNDDVRSAFDRLIATDDAIEVAKAPYKETFTTAEQAGMSAREFAIYQDEALKVSEQAKEKLLAESLEEVTREAKQWWKDERAKMKEQVTAEVNNLPVYRTQDYLTKGLQEDGTQGEPVKLNREILINRYGKAIVKELRGLTDSEGVNPESVAMMWGFSSSDEMIKGLRAAPNRNALINAETDVRMRDTYGDILNDGSLADKAINAVETECREKILLAEQRAINKQLELANKVANIRDSESRQARNEAYNTITPNNVLKQVAQQAISEKRVNEIQPQLYRNAEIKANREAFNAASKKDWEAAARAKEQERLNNFLYREAVKARQEETKIFNYFRKFEKNSTRERIGKAGGDHLEQIDGLLEQYEIKRVSNRQLERRKSLAAYVREQLAQGNIVAIDQAIIDNANQINYRQLTFAELQGLNDAIKNIETIATLKNKLRTAQGERDFKATKDEIIDQLNTTVKVNARVKPLSKSSRTTKQVLQDVGDKIDTSLIRMEHLISNLDGGNVDGIFHQIFWNPLADAMAKEKAMFKADMLDIMKKGDQLTGLNDTHYINSLGRSFDTRQLIMIALNTGNESNKTKLLKGGIDGLQLQPQHLADILAPLTKDKWDFVQEVWSKFDNRWQDIAAMYKRLSGVEPKAVEATPVNTPFGEYKGGYFPIIYDRSRPNAPDAFIGGELFNGDFEGAMPSNGFTNARNDNVTGPLKLEIESISQHMMMQIHDLTHREALQNAYRLAKDRDVRNTLINKLGSEQADLFIKWLKNIANDSNPSGGGVGSRLINAVRNNTSIVGLGFSTTTMLAQIGGVVPVIRYAGAKDFAGGLIQLMQSPLEVPRFIMDKSPAMRSRWDTTQSRIDASFDRLKGKKEFFRQKERVVRFAFDLLNYIDRYVTGAGWMAAYHRALKEGKSEDVAIRAGDAVVRKSQGGFSAMDKASIQYGDDGKVMAMFTMFYTPFSAFYNQGRDLHFEVKNGITSKSKAAAIILATAFFQGVVGDLLTGQGPDDDENLLAWMGKSTLGFGTSGLPLIRDIVSSWTGGRVYSLSPLAQTINKVTSLPKTAKGIVEGKEGKGKQAVEATGLILGIPVKPLTRQGDALYQIGSGEYDPKDAGGFVKALIYGVRKKDKD